MSGASAAMARRAAPTRHSQSLERATGGSVTCSTPSIGCGRAVTNDTRQPRTPISRAQRCTCTLVASPSRTRWGEMVMAAAKPFERKGRRGFAKNA